MGTAAAPGRFLFFAALGLAAAMPAGCAPAARRETAAQEASVPAEKPAPPLTSWNDTRSRRAILDFVERVTRPGPHFVPEPERIAVFDNDGTLWAEQPMYFQLLFAIDRVKALAPKHPEWTNEEPFASILRGNVAAALTGGDKALSEIMAATHAGVTVEEYQKTVRDWLATARHPQTGQLFAEMVYQPMLEVLAYLRASGFKTFIVSGGGVDFMRVFAEQVYGIPPEQVVGSTSGLHFELRLGKPVLVKLPEIVFLNDKTMKPVGIYHAIGRRPIAAFGNSDGDLAMLQWTCDGRGSRLCVFVHHTDPAREWAYDRHSPVGRLDKGLDQAARDGWPVVSMKSDWKTVFPPPASRVP